MAVDTLIHLISLDQTTYRYLEILFVEKVPRISPGAYKGPFGCFGGIETPFSNCSARQGITEIFQNGV
jgi:hypothetical protein